MVDPEAQPPKYAPAAPVWVLTAFLGSVVGAAFVFFLYTGGVNKSPNINYTDLAAVMLGAVTIVLSVLALVIAGAAIWGYRAFMKMAADKGSAVAKIEATKVATKLVPVHIAEIADSVLEEHAKSVALRVITPEHLDQLIRERVDALQNGNERDVALDENEAQYDQAAEQAGEADDDL